jgi:predicted phage terminase large subunit-like protein
MAGLQYVDIPGYAAIIFRRTYADLTKAGALIDRSLKWLGGSSARWISQQHKWVFPSSATLEFGNLEREQDKFRYQSAEFQYIGFDELTQFEESQYRYLFSRLRRLEGVNIPLRMRSASNPGNIGHDWVKRRFMIEGHLHGRIFIPARLDDNPSLDKNKYIESLNELDPITRRQYLLGDWTARHGGSIFLREWFKDKICGAPPHDVRVVRYWDLAATKPKDGRDPDWTVGVKMGAKDGFFYVMDVQRFRGSPSTVEDRVRLTAKLDGVKTRVYMEQEPGSSGVSLIDYYHRKILSGYIFYGVKTTGSKSERAAPFSSACEGGLVSLVDGSWIGSFLDELEAFPVGSHDDQVDASSGAFEQLTRHGNIEVGRGTLSW